MAWDVLHSGHLIISPRRTALTLNRNLKMSLSGAASELPAPTRLFPVVCRHATTETLSQGDRQVLALPPGVKFESVAQIVFLYLWMGFLPLRLNHHTGNMCSCWWIWNDPCTFQFFFCNGRASQFWISDFCIHLCQRDLDIRILCISCRCSRWYSPCPFSILSGQQRAS